MDQQLFVMGLCGDNQFGTVRGEEDGVCAKRPISWCIKPDKGEPDPIVQFCCGEKHSLVGFCQIFITKFYLGFDR